MTPVPAGPLTRRLNILLLVVSLVALVLAVAAGIKSQMYARCQAGINDVLITRTRILNDVGQRERVAERQRDDALDATFLDPAVRKRDDERTPAEKKRILALFATYLRAAEKVAVERVAADKARADNPVPPEPSAVCR